MITWLSWTLLGAGLAMALWTGVTSARRRPATAPQLVGSAVIEVAVLVQAIVAVARTPGAGLAEPATFVAYAVGVLLPLPVGVVLARMERSRWGSAVLCFTALVVAVMVLRLRQLWLAGA